MNLLDQQFKEALKDLPQQRLSWWADRRIKKMLRHRALELEGRSPFWVGFQRFIAAPVAMLFVLSTVSTYAFYTPSVVRGDTLYPVKSNLEAWFYPSSGGSEDRIAYHLWLSDRRYDEVREILQRKGRGDLAMLIPRANAQELNDDESNELDRVLLETLQSASKHVELALVITDEIREVKKVVEVKQQIRESVQKQKVFLEEVKPELQKVKVKKTEKDLRNERNLLAEPMAEVQVESQTDALIQDSVPQVLPPAQRKESDLELIQETSLESLSTPDAMTNEEDLLEQPGDRRSLEKSLFFMTEPVVEQVEDLDAAGFLAQQIAFEEDLLDHLQDTVTVAEKLGADEVDVQIIKRVTDQKKVQPKEVADAEIELGKSEKVLRVAQEKINARIQLMAEQETELLIAEQKSKVSEEAFLEMDQNDQQLAKVTSETGEDSLTAPAPVAKTSPGSGNLVATGSVSKQPEVIDPFAQISQVRNFLDEQSLLEQSSEQDALMTSREMSDLDQPLFGAIAAGDAEVEMNNLESMPVEPASVPSFSSEPTLTTPTLIAPAPTTVNEDTAALEAPVRSFISEETIKKLLAPLSTDEVRAACRKEIDKYCKADDLACYQKVVKGCVDRDVTE